MNEETHTTKFYTDNLLENSYFLGIFLILLLFFTFIVPSVLLICTSWFIYEMLKEKVKSKFFKQKETQKKENLKITQNESNIIKNELLLTEIFNKEREV